MLISNVDEFVSDVNTMEDIKASTLGIEPTFGAGIDDHTIMRLYPKE